MYRYFVLGQNKACRFCSTKAGGQSIVSELVFFEDLLRTEKKSNYNHSIHAWSNIVTTHSQAIGRSIQLVNE